MILKISVGVFFVAALLNAGSLLFSLTHHEKPHVIYVTNTVIREVPAPSMPTYPFTHPNVTNWIYGTPVPAPIYGLYTNNTLRIEAGPYTNNTMTVVPDGGAR